MSYRNALLVSSLLLLSACSGANETQTIGTTKLIQMPANASKSDYRNAMPKACDKTKVCQAVFFSADKPITRLFPITASTANAVTAYYATDPNLDSNKQRLRCNCEKFTDTGADLCLTEAYLNEVLAPYHSK